MSQINPRTENKSSKPYLSELGAWALAFGCSVGWGCFVMPGTTFLPLAGPLGTALGMIAGALVMFILGICYHYLMNIYPDGGGSYTYTVRCFGYDHGFLNAWFLILTYVAIIWANATALPLIVRTLLGNSFQFGFDYVIAGFHCYMGEILLAIFSLVLAALVCLKRKNAEWTQIVAAVILLGGVLICLAAVFGRNVTSLSDFKPYYAPDRSAFYGVFTIFSLTPWAFVGFESICHSSHEVKFSLKKSISIFVIAIISATLAYVSLSLIASSSFPEDAGNWSEYIFSLGKYEGLASQPAFYAIDKAMGVTGQTILGVASLCAILTGLIGNYIALSRLMSVLARDKMLPKWVGELDENDVPRNAIFAILGFSIILPFFGRTAISWIVDVTTIGATITYAFTSASALKIARKENDRFHMIAAILGIIASLMFAIEFLVPNILGITTLSKESYLILAVWSILGFAVFRNLLQKDSEYRLGRSTIAWIVLLALVMFASTVWMYQKSSADIEKLLLNNGGDISEIARSAIGRSSLVQMSIIIVALAILFDIYGLMQKRQQEIEIAKVLAEESSKAKTSFLSNMSHEIRTPMNAIIGLDNIALRNPDLSAKTREQLEKIGSSARHLLGLINDILDMSRIESGRMVLKNEEFSFREFLDQINIMINGQCQDKGLHYDCNIKGHVHDYYIGDDMKLKQVLINILGNSVKFTNAPGSVSLNVEELAEAEGISTLRFTMSDTGIGMDKDFIPKIFEAFSQENATAANHYGGSGLGMAITKNFVEMMDGNIDVQSEKGVGSTFVVTVRLENCDKSLHSEVETLLPENIRTMVVDDDPIALEHGLIVLNSLGIDAKGCEDPEKALKLLKDAANDHPYELLLTDYKMPAMNGLELVKEARKIDPDKLKIIMLTGYNWDIIEDDVQSEGVDAIMAKPLFAENLYKQISSIINVKKDDGALSELDAGSEYSLAGKRILMAEDVDQNAEILEDLLMLEDMECERAANGEEAIAMFNGNPENYYDAILMDVRMPIMDGLEATKRIRALSRKDAAFIPIIAMTANVFDEDVRQSLEAGMNAHLSKPIEPERLYAALRNYISENE